MQTLSLSIDGMTCGHCVASVRHALESVPGATVRAVRIGAAEVALDASTAPDAVIAALQDVGYEAGIARAEDTAEPGRAGRGCCAPAPAALSRAGKSGNSPCHEAGGRR